MWPSTVLLLIIVPVLGNPCSDSPLQCDIQEQAQSLLQVQSQAKHSVRPAVTDSVKALDVDRNETVPAALVDRSTGHSYTSTKISASTAGLLIPVFGLIPLASAFLYVLSRVKASVRLARYLCEYLGTFALVFTVGCCVLSGNSAFNPLAIAAVLMVMIYATGPVSGGNLNPAVSLALGLSGDLEWSVVLNYWVAQILGGVSASGIVLSLFSPAKFTLAPVAPFEGCHAMFAETLYTFMICFVVLNCAASKRNNAPDDGNQFFALAIGFVIVAGGYAVGGVSGAAFNPAVALGLDVQNIGCGWGLWYAVFQLVGACIAALFYNIVRPDENMSAVDFAKYAPSLSSRCVSECLGTFILVVTVGLNLVTGSTATAFSAAAALMCMIYSLGNVSGAHFNPAVTVAVVASGRNKCSARDGAAYILTQVMAGVSAGLVSAFFHAASASKSTTFALKPGEGFNFVSAGYGEFFYTAVLAYIVLATATTAPPASQITKQNFYFALCIGSCVTVGGFAVGALSGGELNPAVSAGVSMMGGLSPGATDAPSYTYMLGFMALELAGGLFAALVFRFTHPGEMGNGSPDEAPTMAARLCCEFVGTFVLVHTVGCCVLAGPPTWAATAIASSLMVMIYATGSTSGGNLNPAVSLSLGLTGDLPWPDVFKYWCAQLAAGLGAGLTVLAIFSPNAPSLAVKDPFTYFHVMCAEVLYTFMLCFVVLNCAASKRNNPPTDGNQFFALAIGFTIIAGGYAAGGISGAALNPAVALGLDCKQLGFRVLAWAAFEMIGALLAAALYLVVRPDEKMSNESFKQYVAPLRNRCVSEFLGVFMLVLTVGLNIIMGSPATAWSAAAALMCMIYALGSVSGGHFNPAVTLAVVTSGRGKCAPRDGLVYVVCQCAAAVAAGLIVAMFHASSPSKDTTFELKPGAGYNTVVAGFMEFAFTSLISYIVLSVATTSPPASMRTKQNFQFALAIGSCVTAGGFAIGGVSGGELNPAVALGVATQSFSVGSLVPLALWELAGGLAASAAFRMTHPEEFIADDEKL